MVSMDTKVVWRDSFLEKLSEELAYLLSEKFTSMDSAKVNRVYAGGGGGWWRQYAWFLKHKKPGWDRVSHDLFALVGPTLLPALLLLGLCLWCFLAFLLLTVSIFPTFPESREKIWKLQSANQYNMRSEWHWFVPCDLQIFSGCVCHLEQLHAQSPFLFPIVFSINFLNFLSIGTHTLLSCWKTFWPGRPGQTWS